MNITADEDSENY